MPNSLLAADVVRLAGWRVLVVGDLTLDEYLFGQPTRLSREAPVPVLELRERQYILGGAANPARNIVALGSTAVQVGVVGDDREGEHMRAAFAAAAIDAAGVVTLPDRPTTVKTRIMAHEPPRLPQQLARLDRLQRGSLTAADSARVLATIERLLPTVDAVLCSDYQLGLLSAEVVAAMRAACRARRILHTVDAQGNADYYHGIDLFRCNDREAAATLGVPLHSEDDFRRGLRALQARLHARLVIVTRGPDGLSLQTDAGEYQHIAAHNTSEVYDTTGAGDTFIAVVTLGLVAGLSPVAAAQIATVAAGQVVQRLGNAVVTPAELMAACARPPA